jgi:heme exporter protein D
MLIMSCLLAVYVMSSYTVTVFELAGGISEVTSAHEAGELDGPERQRQRDAAIRRGRRHLGAAAGVRRPQQQHSLRRSSYPLTRRDVPTRYTLRWPRCRQERNRSRSS